MTINQKRVAPEVVMSPTHEKPLPGDLVIRGVPAADSGGTLYFIAVYPQLDHAAAATDLSAAVERARHLAQIRGGALQVWREESSAPVKFTKLEPRASTERSAPRKGGRAT